MFVSDAAYGSEMNPAVITPQSMDSDSDLAGQRTLFMNGFFKRRGGHVALREVRVLVIVKVCHHWPVSLPLCLEKTKVHG